eukprot:956802-Pelagomonas_calceolata.AAC.5
MNHIHRDSCHNGWHAFAGVMQGERSTSASTFGAAVNLWRNLSSRLFDLEAGILTTASATQQQTTTVRMIKQQVQWGSLVDGFVIDLRS